MGVESYEFTVELEGYCHLEDITGRVQQCLDRSPFRNGIACVSVIGSTGAIGTLEYEPGLIEDLPEFFESILPSNQPYHHDDTWHDGNGFSHMRSFLTKTSQTFPFNDKKLILGTWQQVVLANFDNRRRNRRVVVQLVGD